MLKYGEKINISYDYTENIVKKQIEILNGEKLIEKCSISNNKDISSIANSVLQKFFSKDESNILNN